MKYLGLVIWSKEESLKRKNGSLEVHQSCYLGLLNPDTFSINGLILCQERVLLAL